jgi:hypothetical protein
MMRKSDLDDFRGERFERVMLILTAELIENCLADHPDSNLKENIPAVKHSKESEMKHLQVNN